MVETGDNRQITNINQESSISMNEFMAWLYCPSRLYFENTFRDYDDSDLSEIILDLQARATAGELTSKQIDELRVFELLLEERVQDPSKKAETILLETKYTRLVEPILPMIIKSLGISIVISIIFFYILR